MLRTDFAIRPILHLEKRCVECLGCVLLVLRKKVEAPNFSGIGDAASWSCGIEVEGLWGDEAATFLTLLAHTKARQTPALLHHSLTNALIYGSSAMLTHAAMHVFASSFLDQDLAGCHNIEGNTPSSISGIIAEVSNLRHPAPS